MQNLNDRLASYLEKVHSLEVKNKELELNIREFCSKTTFVTKDHSAYLSTIADLQAEIIKICSGNQSILLQTDNAKLAADDFQMKYELELSMRNTVEADVIRLRGIRDNLTLTLCSLETNVENLKEELVSLANTHKNELEELRVQGTGSVKVEVDSAESADLTKVLEEVRQQYETLMKNNKLELEKWFKSKMEILQSQIISCTTEVKTYHTEISELKRTYQVLEISRQALYNEVKCLQQNEMEVNARYAALLSQHQATISSLEAELQEMKMSLEQLQIKYTLLLELKPRLEREIEEYRRLLGGDELEQRRAVIIKETTEEVEEQKPHIEKRVKTIVEQIIDGKVVSSTEDTKVQTIQ
ncbi:keratin, type I cytoskeletal 47 kDa [Austrofundulus limnaeus]|uniref:Keratin, type I cytoskeletal 47 kDa n=1 Tax=Austrofundulus limnaeus TaxID=52670 RepID=A0A2I4BD19_AUSLI|nr:PREDICTED: keratin, type I cytoskeletal 47 kDa-like [Austrofundulus limnaeus]